MFDAASRGRYSTDASIYQVAADRRRCAPQRRGRARGDRHRGRGRRSDPAARRRQLAVRPGRRRGAGHRPHQVSQPRAAGRRESRSAIVQPGVVLDALNAQLRKHGLWFPVDVSTSAQATLGGMAGNNSCGSRSIAYGNMVHNVLAIDAFTTSGERWHFGPMDQNLSGSYGEFIARLKGLYEREKQESSVPTRAEALLGVLENEQRVSRCAHRQSRWKISSSRRRPSSGRRPSSPTKNSPISACQRAFTSVCSMARRAASKSSHSR